MKELTSYNRVAGYLNKIFDLLNAEYFENTLSRPTITIQSTPKAYGHFTLSGDTWVSKLGGTHEINIGAGTLARPIEYICATLLHEMIHYKNHEDGIQDTSRGGTYHNKHFKESAEACGLIVEHSEKYGWSHTSPADSLLDFVLENGLTDILIISPPGGGKTTCLREFIRQISDMGYRVSVADERGEICAVVNGEPQFDTGTHCDIICDAPKAKAAMMLIKAMNPELLAMDEISSREDIAAVYEASGCGVHILATAHAASTDDLYRRRIYRELMETDIFRYCLVIENRHGVRSYSIEEL